MEILSNLGSFSQNGSLFRVILAEKLDILIEERKSFLPETCSKETLVQVRTLSLDNVQISVALDEFNQILPSGFLAILTLFAKSLGFFDPFLKHFHLGMKEVKYTLMDKIATLFSSIAAGCSYIRDINHKLTPYPLAASLFGMDRFPDQSQINRFLNKIGPEQVSQLTLIFEAILDKLFLFENKQKVDINVDVTGLVVYGEKYQFAKRGYFPNHRGKKGYQLSLGTVNYEYSQILSVILDPGNIALNVRLWDTIYEIAEVLGSLDKIGIIRADAIYGIGPDIAELKEHDLSFLIKGKNPLTAKNILKRLNPSYDDWKRVDETTWAFDAKYIRITNCPYPVRTVIAKQLNAKGELKYRHIYASFSSKELDGVETILSYRKRIDVEAIIRDDKYGLYIDNLRTKNFWGIWAYLLVACCTHNLISLFRDKVLRGTGIEDLGIQTIVKKLADIPAKYEKEQGKVKIFFPSGHELARRFIQGKQDNHKGSTFPLKKKLYN